MAIAGAFSRAVLPRQTNTNRGRITSRSARLVVQAKVNLQGAPRVIRGKCFVTRDVSNHMPLANWSQVSSTFALIYLWLLAYSAL
jgi:hypothetical protein